MQRFAFALLLESMRSACKVALALLLGLYYLPCTSHWRHSYSLRLQSPLHFAVWTRPISPFVHPVAFDSKEFREDHGEHIKDSPKEDDYLNKALSSRLLLVAESRSTKSSAEPPSYPDTDHAVQTQIDEAGQAALHDHSGIGANGVKLPGEVIRLSRPLIVKAGSGNGFAPIRIQGAGPNQTILKCSGAFPAMWVEPPAYVSSLGGHDDSTLPTDSPPQGMAGSALKFLARKPYFFDLLDVLIPSGRSGTACTEPQLTNGFTRDGYFKLSGARGYRETIDDYGVRDNLSDTTLLVRTTVDGPFEASIATTGGPFHVSVKGPFSRDIWYYYRVSWDPQYGLYGYAGLPHSILQAAHVGTRGALYQWANELWWLGGESPDGWPEGAAEINPFNGALYSTRLDGSSMNPTDVIVAPAKALQRANATLVLINGNRFYDAFVGLDVPEHAWLPARNISYQGNALGPQVEQLGFSGCSWAMQAVQVPQSLFSNLTSVNSGRGCFEFWNNDYFSGLYHSSCVASTCGQVGLGLEWPISEVQDYAGDASVYGIVIGNNGAGIIQNAKLAIGAHEIHAFDIRLGNGGYTEVTLIDPTCDAENGGNADCIYATEAFGYTARINIQSGVLISQGSGFNIHFGALPDHGNLIVDSTATHFHGGGKGLIKFDDPHKGGRVWLALHSPYKEAAGPYSNHDAWIQIDSDPATGDKPRIFAGRGSDAIPACGTFNDLAIAVVADAAHGCPASKTYAPEGGAARCQVSCVASAAAWQYTGVNY